MKKFLIFILILVVACFLAAQYLLPRYIEMHIEDQLNAVLHPEAQSVSITSDPGVKLLYGEADNLSGSLQNIRVGGLNFSSFTYSIDRVVINPVSLAGNQDIDILSIGQAGIEGIITKDDLTEFLAKQQSDFTDVSVEINNQHIILSGEYKQHLFRRQRLQEEGTLELKDNALYYAPSRLVLNGATVSGVTSEILEPIRIYDFNTFPIPVKAEKVTVENGAVRIKVTPVLN